MSLRIFIPLDAGAVAVGADDVAAALAQATPAPFYVDFMVDDSGVVLDTRVVALVEYPIRLEGA